MSCLFWCHGFWQKTQKKRNFLIFEHQQKRKMKLFILERSSHRAGVFTDMANNKHVYDSINCKWLWWPQSKRTLRRDSNVRWGTTFFCRWLTEVMKVFLYTTHSWESSRDKENVEQTCCLFSVAYLKHVCIKTLEVAEQSDDYSFLSSFLR